MYQVIPRMNGDGLFPMSGVPVSLELRELEMESTLSLRGEETNDKPCSLNRDKGSWNGDLKLETRC